MTTKNSIVLDHILKGMVINKNGEVDYRAEIDIVTKDNVEFQYAIVDEGYESSPSQTFSTVRKSANVQHTNSDGVYKKKVLLLKSPVKTEAEVSIKLVNNTPYREEFGPVGQVNLLMPRQQQPTNSAPLSVVPRVEQAEETTPWYKNPWIIGGIVLAVLLLVMLMANNNKKKTSYFLE
ncbi:hypothetical protein AV955_gp024 [Diadromus pulchellus ascovirus 4a]|uniref:Complete DpAV4 genome n=1 Tax=Diadromus pulchellus ascovirus 4a TaxID=158683 RepID=F2NYV3_9VIRU|nr:hypothetical protein AV955_gp024 [Diadromus pulchellus ascovirus 4a]CCA61381.1 unnamed protein product [Diadromus pulchellus ascovirus 4a]